MVRCCRCPLIGSKCLPGGRFDFELAKLESARDVIDAGTRRRQTFTFDADELLIAAGTLPDGTELVSEILGPPPFGPKLQWQTNTSN